MGLLLLRADQGRGGYTPLPYLLVCGRPGGAGGHCFSEVVQKGVHIFMS